MEVLIQFISVYCFILRMYKKQENLDILEKLMARRPKGSHRAYKEWAPGSFKLLQQNINRIIH